MRIEVLKVYQYIIRKIIEWGLKENPSRLRHAERESIFLEKH
jgi:hypothetical protein